MTLKLAWHGHFTLSGFCAIEASTACALGFHRRVEFAGTLGSINA